MTVPARPPDRDPPGAASPFTDPAAALDLMLGGAVIGLRLGALSARLAVASSRTVLRLPLLEAVVEGTALRVAAVGRRARHELQDALMDAADSRASLELTDRVLDSASMQRAVEHVFASPQLRRAVAEESAGMAERTLEGVRQRSAALDDRAESKARGWLRRPEQHAS